MLKQGKLQRKATTSNCCFVVDATQRCLNCRQQVIINEQGKGNGNATAISDGSEYR